MHWRVTRIVSIAAAAVISTSSGQHWPVIELHPLRQQSPHRSEPPQETHGQDGGVDAEPPDGRRLLWIMRSAARQPQACGWHQSAWQQSAARTLQTQDLKKSCRCCHFPKDSRPAVLRVVPHARKRLPSMSGGTPASRKFRVESQYAPRTAVAALMRMRSYTVAPRRAALARTMADTRR